VGSTLAQQHPRDASVHPAPAAGATERRKAIRQRRTRTYRTADWAMLLFAALAAVLAAPGAATTSDFVWGGAYAVLTIAILEVRGFYGARLHDAPVDVMARIFAATSISAMLLTFLHAVVDNDTMLAQQSLRLWAFGLVFLGAGRLGITLDRRRALRRGETGANTLIIGAGSVGHLIGQRLIDRPELGLRPIGFLDKDPLIDRSTDDDGLPVLGASWDLAEVVQRYNVEQVVVTFSTAPHAVMLGLIRRCRDLGVEVVIVPRLFEEVNNRVEVEHLGGIPLLRAAQIDPRGWQFSIKYAIDRFVALVALILLSPVLLVLAAAVKLTSPGPLLFRQARVGLNGRKFDMLKFRTMTGDASVSGESDAAWAAAITGEAASEPADDAPAAPKVDRRTPIGRILRKLSLDELPQLFNVLHGDMSLIGPRPERAGYVDAFKDHLYRYGDRHRVKSGLTGWAQVQGLRGETSLTDRVEWDNYYIENWSFWLDLKIVLMTIPVLFGPRGVE
jgi:exopolysaccharide biosynthesis polyprenyl glycosylphosphotransferase